MSAKILKEIPEHFIMRMRNWAWTNAGGGQRLTSCMYVIAGGGRYPESSIPILIGEAEDTGMALSQLPNRYKQAVSLFWQYEGRPLTWFAMRCGRGVDWRTYEKRVIHGHELLKTEIARQREKVVAYRLTVKNLETA